MTTRILVVEDEETVRFLISSALEKVGHTVAEAENGVEAERLLKAQTFDLVITDLIMPERDGLETIRYLRAHHPEVKIIAVSTPSTLMLLECARLLGAHGTLAKPFTLMDLEQAVDRVMTDSPADRGQVTPVPAAATLDRRFL